MRRFSVSLLLAMSLTASVSIALTVGSARAQSVSPEAVQAAASVATPVGLPHTFGVVRSRTTWHVELEDGRTVDLSRATQIVPVGDTISRGDLIGIYGVYSRPMTIRANSVTVVRPYSSSGVGTAR